MRRNYIFILLIICLKLSGEEKITTVFYNLNWEITTPQKATYYRFTGLNNTGDFYDGKYTDFLVKDKSMVSIGEYSNNHKNGEFIEYFSNGNIKKKGNYNDDHLIGNWYYYYPNGQLKMIMYFMDKDFQPIECRDSLNNISLEKGTGKWETEIYINGKLAKLIAKFKKGKRNGEWKYLDNSGKEIYSEEYINSELNCYDHFGNRKYVMPGFTMNYFLDSKYYKIEHRAYENNFNMKFAPFNWITKTLNLTNTVNISYLNSKLPADQILFINEDRHGNTWFGTGNNGLIKYDSVFTFYNKDNSPIKSNYVSCMAIDKNDKIWFPFKSSIQRTDIKNAGLACLSNNNIVVYNTGNSGLTNNGINDIAIDKDNKKWFATENCIISYDDSIKKWEKHINKMSDIRKIDTIKYKNQNEYLRYAKEINSETHSWEENINQKNRFSNNTQIENTGRYYLTTTYYESPIDFYRIEILPTNEKLINSIRNGCCIYNEKVWECDSISSNLQYVKNLLVRKLQMNTNDTLQYMNQLSKIMKKNIIFQLISGIDNSLWVRTNNNVFKVTKNRIIEFDLFDNNIKYIQDGDFKTKFYNLYQDKKGGIWACINSAVLKIE